MKKQILLIATLAGALFLGSCVDDKESASVTAVREAKAEQLKGLAALAQAQAQAATMAAEADAALKQAQAAYYEAQAAYEQARTEEAKANVLVNVNSDPALVTVPRQRSSALPPSSRLTFSTSRPKLCRPRQTTKRLFSTPRPRISPNSPASTTPIRAMPHSFSPHSRIWPKPKYFYRSIRHR